MSPASPKSSAPVVDLAEIACDRLGRGDHQPRVVEHGPGAAVSAGDDDVVAERGVSRGRN